MLAERTVRLSLNPFLSRWSTLSFWSDWDTTSHLARMLADSSSSFSYWIPTLLICISSQILFFPFLFLKTFTFRRFALWRSAKMCQSEWKASLPTVLTCPSPSAGSPFEFSLETRSSSFFFMFFFPDEHFPEPSRIRVKLPYSDGV